MRSRAAAAVGADIGGTWIRAVLLLVPDIGKLRSLNRFSDNSNFSTSLCLAPVAPPRRGRTRLAGRTPAAALGALLRGWGIRRADALVAGAKGAGGPKAPPHWRRALARVARRVSVTGDLELARDAAFGGGAGVLLIAGTGSSALARADDGRIGRAGGRGPLLGDEGSGFWIGRRWLQGRPDAEALRLARRPDAVAAVSATAPGILRRARRGAPLERALAREAASHLAALAQRAAAGLFPGRAPLCLHGGLAADPWFRALVLRRLGKRFTPRSPAASPEAYAARRAVELLSWP